jgi:Nuclease-related domain
MAVICAVVAFSLFILSPLVFSFGIITLIVWLISVVLLGLAGWHGWQAWQKQQETLVEDRLETILTRFLGNDYIYFRNLVLPDTPSVGEIDGVLLGSHGAIVFQLENQEGEFICEGDTWFKYTGAGKAPETVQKPLGVATLVEIQRKQLEDSPSWQAIRATREVKAWLSVRDLPQILVQPVVVLSKGKLHSSKVPSCPIIRLEEIETYLRAKFAPVNSEVVNLNEVEQITLRLQAGQ